MRKNTIFLSLIIIFLFFLCTHSFSEANQGTYYIVKYGDTLSSISSNTGVYVNTLMQLNNIINQDAIYAGQRLWIPHIINNTIKYHSIVYGETLFSIANYYNVDLWDLAEANGIYNLNLIYPNKVLVVPY